MYHMNVTAAMLADAASVCEGKLFIHGGGWDTVHVGGFPTIHPRMSLAFVIRLEYSEALVDIPIRVELLDEDESPAGIRIDGMLNAGHPAGMQPGSPLFIPQALPMSMLQFTKPGQYRFKVSSGERELASVPFRLAQLPGPPQPAS
jgi:hypothetical protein